MWRKNPDRESKKQNHARRIKALEIHIQDTEARYAELENRFNVLREEFARLAKTMDEEWDTDEEGRSVHDQIGDLQHVNQQLRDKLERYGRNDDV